MTVAEDFASRLKAGSDRLQADTRPSKGKNHSGLDQVAEPNQVTITVKIILRLP